MKLLIVTGMSGAGKSQTIKILEDLGYFCIDNMPPALIAKLTELYVKGDAKLDKIALTTDIRGRNMLEDLFPALNELQDMKVKYDILFLEASDRCLINRFKETRRMHPLSRAAGSLENAIKEERKKLAGLKKKATYVVDTTDFSSRDLQNTLSGIFLEGEARGLLINVMSFGYKYGLPQTCDLAFDVRFLPNPYYVPELKKLTGLDKRVADYVLNTTDCNEFITKLFDLVDFLIPKYINEGKAVLVIGIGCTGGKHRSVAISEELKKHIEHMGFPVNMEHRDVIFG